MLSARPLTVEANLEKGVSASVGELGEGDGVRRWGEGDGGGGGKSVMG